MHTIGDYVRCYRFCLQNVEDGVDGLHEVQKLECDGMSAWLCNGCERLKVCLCEFPQGPSGTEVLDFDESLVTDFEI